jgi:hypothetical protein
VYFTDMYSIEIQQLAGVLVAQNGHANLSHHIPTTYYALLMHYSYHRVLPLITSFS